MTDVFQITPASGNTFWMLVPIVILMVVLALVFVYFGYSSSHATFEVSPDGLRIHSAIYGRFVPAASLVTARAKEINLARDSDHRLTLKTNGIGLPGYRAGWFRLGNGEKALVFVTDTSHVVYVPTQDGYSLLLSPSQPEAFIASLRLNTASASQ
jgi:PH (Pleckstrin Homology) domain-containing protein